MDIFHRITEIKPLADFELLATFSDGTVKKYDVKPLFSKYEAFLPLKYIPHLFGLVRTDCGGLGIMWNDEIDLSSDEIWYNGTEVK